jgi:hypothetical protein
MLHALLYAIIRRVLRLGGVSSDTEAEVLVLRHELTVLRRQITHPKLRRRDKLFPAAMSRMLEGSETLVPRTIALNPKHAS